MPIPSPYDDRIARLRDRLQKPGQQPNAQRRLRDVRGQRQGFRQQARGPAPVPYSGRYETTVGGANRDYNFAQSDIAGQRLATEQQYGFGGDQSNPYSVARTLERERGQQFNRTGNSYARSGQLYAGSMNRARESDRFNADRALDEQMRAYQARLADFSRDEYAALSDRDSSIAAAEAQRLEDALQQAPDPSEAPRGGRPRPRNRPKKKGKR